MELSYSCLVHFFKKKGTWYWQAASKQGHPSLGETVEKEMRNYESEEKSDMYTRRRAGESLAEIQSTVISPTSKRAADTV